MLAPFHSLVPCAPADARAAPRLGPARALICVLDGDEAVRDALAASLAAAGFEVLAFACATDFLAALQPWPAACLVVDLDLPDSGAFGLRQTLAARSLCFPMVLMTRRLQRGAELMAVEDDLIRILEKPFGEDELMRDIGWLLQADIRKAPDFTGPVDR